LNRRQGWATIGVEAVLTAWAMRSRRWWSRGLRIPWPDRTYLQWRSYTAYGEPHARMTATDLRSFLTWRTGFRRYVRRLR
jgi:hypothetical protein